MNEQAVDFEAITDIQRQVWSEGDFARIGVSIMSVAEELAEAVNIRAGERVLDVATGAGNGAIAAARRSWEPAVGLDYVPALLERGRERAAAEGFEVEFVEGDAQQMPFEDGSFDVVMSIFGAMFAPDHQRTANELLRVCRPGGRIAMANWTPSGLTGQMFRTLGGFAAPPPGVDPPPLWGTEEHLRKLFGDRVSELRIEPRQVTFRYRSADHWIEFFRTWFGPVKMAYQRVDEDAAEKMTEALRGLLEGANTDDETLVAKSEYLQVVAVRNSD